MARNRTPADASAALFVRIPAKQAEALDRAAFALGRAKREVVSALLERYVDPDSPEALAALAADDRRRASVQTLDAGGLTVGHHSFRPAEPEVLTIEQAAELLSVNVAVVEQLAERGEIPARRLGEEWRLSRRAVLDWLAAGAGGEDR